MRFFKNHWLKIIVLLPFIPVIFLSNSLDNLEGFNENLRTLAIFVLLAGAFVLFFIGLFLESCKGGNPDNRIIKMNIGKFHFGILEVLRGLFGIAVVAIFAMGVHYAIIVTRLERVVADIVVDIPDLPGDTVLHVERSYSFVVMADFDDDRGSYGRIGMLPPFDDSYEAAFESFLADQNYIPNFITEFYQTPFDLVEALYNGEINAMIISSNFVQSFYEREQFENIATDTIVLSSFYVEIEQSGRAQMVPGEPFSMLLLGLDTPDDGDLTMGRFDTLMLITVNLENLSFSLVSVPRDSYVFLPCFHHYDRLGHTGGNAPCAVEAVENILDMEIPYYAVVNFSGVLDIVDVLGGLTIDVPRAFREQNSQNRFGRHMIYVEAGLQRLNGEEVLALARNRDMPDHDFGRAANGQLVMEALIREMLSNMDNLSDALPMFEILGRNIDTNFTRYELMSLAQHMLSYVSQLRTTNLMDEIHFKQMVIFGDSLNVHGMAVMTPWPSSVAAARRLMMINLGLEDPEFTFEFSFDGFARQSRQWDSGGGFENNDDFEYQPYVPPVEIWPPYIPADPPQDEPIYQPEDPIDLPEDPIDIPDDPIDLPDDPIDLPEDPIDVPDEDDSVFNRRIIDLRA